MKFDIPKEWLLKRAPLEEGHEIGAGKQTIKGVLKTMPVGDILDSMESISRKLQNRKDQNGTPNLDR